MFFAGRVTGGVCTCWFSQNAVAFDTIDHGILLERLVEVCVWLVEVCAREGTVLKHLMV